MTCGKKQIAWASHSSRGCIERPMANLNPTDTQRTGRGEGQNKPDDEVFNDSLGTVDPADSTGSDEAMETGDAKSRNMNTRED